MLTRALAVGTVVALLTAAWFGWSWWSAARDDGLARGREREAVLAAASGQLEVLNTIDYRSGAQDVDRWLGVTTGRLGKDLTGDRKVQIDRATTSKTVATAKLKQAAVTELDAVAGTARLMAVLDVRVSTGGGSAAPKVSRLTVDYQRVEDGWKVSAVQAAGS
ncbi:hypothetical protein DL991_17740 [Amycolatopsis sp. WAC 01375]|uniref:hypothetical protein n=1 Tax=unclassified Amycolatopsis TaxID=2618356 RepID=UPI000F781A27|nr:MULTISPECIES: hypothetical protein [unclassified Amycolatopsis]RSM78423.1 hypothetical protein DL991_17740 [Amycolatopsis sp. WAC 01375]RSN30887.1 hypothetical protein DL990_23325 [Amycolatopsis sp. WAC 01416]